MNHKSILSGCFADKVNCQKLLYEHYYDYAFRIAFRYIYSNEQVADLVNNGFVKLLLNIHLFINREELDAEAAVNNALKKIVIDLAIDSLLNNNIWPEMDPVPDLVRSMPLYSQNQNALVYKELISHLRSLPPWPRILYNMHVIDGFTQEEIADRFGISVNSCKLYLSLARMALQKRIAEKMDYLNMTHTLPAI
jgi:RNA polymerase sigma factor (sigma-70 family)